MNWLDGLLLCLIKGGDMPYKIERTVCGIGFNSGGNYETSLNKKQLKVYKLWAAMMNRCYNPIYLKQKPNYIGCTVCEEWHDFQNFAKWFYSERFHIFKYELDKDILIKGNKIYSPETCCLVPHSINMLITNSGSKSGGYPQGISLHKGTGKFRVRLGVYGKIKYIGLFNSEALALSAYKKAKESHIRDVALENKDLIEFSVFEALMNWQVE